MAAYGGPIRNPRDGEIRLIGEFHGWGRIDEDQLELLFLSRRPDTNGCEATALSCLLRAEFIAASREGRKHEDPCCVCFRLCRAQNTLMFQSYRGVAYRLAGRVEDCAPDQASVRALGNRHRDRYAHQDGSENIPKMRTPRSV